MTASILDAAQARSAGVAQRSHRPRERRSGELAGTPAMSRAVLSTCDLRAADSDGGLLRFEGLASATESPYLMYDFFGEYHEVISRGAFGATLARDGLDVPLVLSHDQMRRIASTLNGTLQLAETDAGLQVLADLDPTDLDVQYIAPKLRSGLIREMSFGFRIESGVWSPDYTEYRIERVDIHRGDVAIVGYGANPATTAALRSAAPAGMSLARLRSFLD